MLMSVKVIETLVEKFIQVFKQAIQWKVIQTKTYYCEMPNGWPYMALILNELSEQTNAAWD